MLLAAVEPWAGWFVVAAFAGILLWEQVWDLPGHAALSGKQHVQLSCWGSANITVIPLAGVQVLTVCSGGSAVKPQLQKLSHIAHALVQGLEARQLIRHDSYGLSSNMHDQACPITSALSHTLLFDDCLFCSTTVADTECGLLCCVLLCCIAAQAGCWC